jgi:hypothetical protein
MSPIDLGTAMNLLDTIKNGGGDSINKYRVSCVINYMGAQNGSAIIVAPNGIQGDWNDDPIEGGGGAKTDRCNLDWVRLSGPVSCVDLTIEVNYEISNQSGTLREKSMRFVAAQSNGPHWFQESPVTPGNYCQGITETKK